MPAHSGMHCEFRKVFVLMIEQQIGFHNRSTRFDLIFIHDDATRKALDADVLKRIDAWLPQEIRD